MDFCNVAGEGDVQQVVGTATHGLALGDGLLTTVVVKQLGTVGTNTVVKIRYGGGKSVLCQWPEADIVLAQEKTSFSVFSSVAELCDGNI